MKKHIIITAIALCPLLSNAQNINFTKGSVTYSFPAETAGEMTFAGETVTVAARQFALPEWSQITVNDALVDENTVVIEYNGSSASVTIAGNIAQYVEAEVNGAHVTITQSDMVSESTCGEISYSIKGESADGSLTLNGAYKSTLELRGLILTNPSGAALDIQNGKRIALSAKSGTENFLTDGSGSQKGAINCKGHLELKGKGALSVKGISCDGVFTCDGGKITIATTGGMLVYSNGTLNHN